MRTVTVIEAPTSAGGYAPGQEDGPRALLEAGLIDCWMRPVWRYTAADRRLAFGGARTPTTPGQRMPGGHRPCRPGRCAGPSRSRPGTTIVVLGGDCTVGVGTMAGLRNRVERLGIVYVDRHADLNVPDSTVDGALDWMGVAHMLDIAGAVDGLAALAGHRPMLGGQTDQLPRARAPHGL